MKTPREKTLAFIYGNWRRYDDIHQQELLCGDAGKTADTPAFRRAEAWREELQSYKDQRSDSQKLKAAEAWLESKGLYGEFLSWVYGGGCPFKLGGEDWRR